MNKWKVLAILFSLFSWGALQETFRIFTSRDADIADNRSSLMPMSAIMTAIIIFFTIWFWIKSSRHQKR